MGIPNLCDISYVFFLPFHCFSRVIDFSSNLSSIEIGERPLFGSGTLSARFSPETRRFAHRGASGDNLCPFFLDLAVAWE